MKHEQKNPAHPAHPSQTGRRSTQSGGHRDKPSPAFEQNDADGFSSAALWRRLPLSVGVVLLLTLLLVTAFAAVALRAPDPLSLITPLSWGAVGIASLVGGVVAARRLPERPVVAGLLCGGAVVLLLTIGGFLLGKSTPSGWILRFCVLPLHLLGALLARPRAKPAAHHAGGHHHAR